MVTDLRWAMLEMISELRSSIVCLNVMIDELVEGANTLDGEPVAGAMRGLAQRHRVKVLEMEGRLAALNSDYDARFYPEP